MSKQISIEEIKELSSVQINELCDLLIKVVEDDASIGFLAPLKKDVATEYIKSVITPSNLLLVAKINEKIVGSVQLELATKQNATHRSEIAKLMTHPDYRRKGIGRQLMVKAEEIAREHNRSLMILDTRKGDASNYLYQSLGYLEAGQIPNYALSSTGKLDTTVYYYKVLDQNYLHTF
ncbi:GNAT family N-acetyltransferase [Alkalihalobacillus pseudalcaliphilus]|uniref:GNAT family N-acetyltransferase n=1 Tax=Alkalihalobacillus pseudalcaliphilus TaxID=79884 RepID=UPI00064D8BC0|nr:GNAT family N-acetyltransferase [Alkalihalobacillus pseudalcaliphilus]KMK76251.1 GCN5 family acetyltransferase [Alkalihalobacillus pseudalcaliphilus]